MRECCGQGGGGGGGEEGGEEHGDVGSTQPGQSIPVSVCFLLPIPSFLGEKRVCTTREVWSSVHLNPLPAPRKAGHPSACCLGDGEMPEQWALAGWGCFLLHH